MPKRVSELEGAELDYWVAKALGLPIQHDPMGFKTGSEAGFWIWDYPHGDMLKIGRNYSPSTDWIQGGPIIERGRIGVHWSALVVPPQWMATSATHIQVGPTPLIAAMRCFVASKFGEELPDTP